MLNKAADLDGLRAELLKGCTSLDQAPLDLCNLYLSSGCVLPDLTQAWVQPIRKAGNAATRRAPPVTADADYDQHRASPLAPYWPRSSLCC
jgi:hypothetical protein